ncbi:MAG: rRNA maturation RNase YbeY [Candidatus Kerfeldbacteria bacterium RIFCSPLOWO2_01_FULL_48_11]|uniref:Endoribonuclease YbeY n=1 Tax=Candidatus Kerfeldbacteria bacterium RIFCSPLOWO2_01_FULL_48_11 TaxID=1798543 RepID=A0A1G2B4T2_9BACT|nr:MAG: putative rRNA maturation factor [Parcubacteria group bacterium GW2011_GWA2_48_9]KKW13482.1 MAG: putative rRNA maturation factor [Parcubacteria group bacterium GW2011_GWC2_49_9]OGY84188.1 MAG: rRNA maturation RNase YbeY [Candidatus Kerfeldbacteria bacterium RIFCSPLOWO2_01_FULL_48_11]
MDRKGAMVGSIRCIDGIRYATRDLARTLVRVRHVLSIPRSRTIYIILCGAGTIRRLNRTYRNINRVTDVLSFRYGHGKHEGVFGEIFICVPRARSQAQQYGNAFSEEMRLLMIHGLLHILGHDHATARQAKRMRSLENTLLGKNLSRSAHR